MDVSVRQLRSFIAVAKLGSFTQAAAGLHIAQPTLTVQIKLRRNRSAGCSPTS